MANDNMVFSLELGKQSIPGKNRRQNEDHVGYYFPQQAEALLLRGQMVMVADGNGEDGAGEIASKLVVQTVIQEYFDEPWIGTTEEMLTKALKSANLAVHDINVETKPATNLTCSVTCAVIHQDTLYLAHIGNCRAYFLTGNQFGILTQSHALDVATGDRPVQIPEKEEGKFLVRSLGIDEDIKIDLVQRKLQINDMLLLCTDGIYQTVPEQEIQHITLSVSAQPACDFIVKLAAENGTEDDATALMIKMKSIKRIESGDEFAPPKTDTPSQAADRQIVIKGIRYRSTMKVAEMPPEEKEGVAEFSQDRDMRRPIFKQTEPGSSLPSFSIKPILKILAIIALSALLIFLILEYAPRIWQSLTAPSVEKEIQESERALQQPAQVTPSKPSETKPEAIVEPPFEESSEDSVFFAEEEPIVNGGSSLNVAVLDGSLRQNLSWESYLQDMKTLSAADRINKMKSTIRLKKSKIIWRRVPDSQKAEKIKERVEQYQRLFARYFQINPETFPLDLTLVLGANFKLPSIKSSGRANEASDDYYLEILNGSPVTGLAGRMSQQLDRQPIDDGRIVVVDYRNADRKTYKVTFIQCHSSQNKIAGELKARLKVPVSVMNSPLFDIKILVGTDIVM